MTGGEARPPRGGAGERLGFSRARRVRRHADFQRIQAAESRAGRAVSAHFVFLVAPSANGRDAPSRLGVVVTRKLGNAVARNRVKRLCRECFRLWPGFVSPGVDLLVIGRQGSPLLGLAEVRAEWARAHGALGHRVREALARHETQPHVVPRRTRDASDDPTDTA